MYILECEVAYEGSWVIDVFECESDANIERDIQTMEDGGEDCIYKVVKWDIIKKDEKLIALLKSHYEAYPRKWVNGLNTKITGCIF